MADEMPRLLSELSHEIRAMRAELKFVRRELAHIAGGLAVVVSQSRDNKKKLPVLLTIARASTIVSGKSNRPGN
jgi:hypothetical protein